MKLIKKDKRIMKNNKVQKRVKSLISKNSLKRLGKNRKVKLLQVAGGFGVLLLLVLGAFAQIGWLPGADPETGQQTGWFGAETAKNGESGSRNQFAEGFPATVEAGGVRPAPTPINNPEFTGTVEFAPFRKEYRYATSGGNDTAWKKVADITFDEQLYSGAAFEVNVLNSLSNWGTHTNIKRMTFYVSATRSGRVLNDRDKGHVSGPVADYVRLVRKSTGVFELHIRQIANWRHIGFAIRAVSASKETITYVDSPVNGSSSGTVYMPVPNPNA